MSTPFYYYILSISLWCLLFFIAKRKRLFIINVTGVALYGGYLIDTLISTQHTNLNIVFWKITRTGDHHFLDMIGIIASLFVYAVVFYKNPRTVKYWGVFAFFTNYTMIAINETGWYLSYDINSVIQHNYFNPLWILYSYFDVYLLTIGAFVFFAWKFKIFAIPFKTTLILAIFFGYWISIGFPVTIGYYGYTPYYYNLYINIIEVVHWFVAIFAFLVEQTQYINPTLGLRLSQKVRLILPKPKEINTNQYIPLVREKQHG